MAAEKGCWERLLRRAAEKGCWEGLLRRAAEKGCWERLLRQAAEKGCWERLLRKAAEKGCWEGLLRKAAEKGCWERLLRKAAKKGCWERLLRKAAEKGCWQELLFENAPPLKMLLLFKISSLFFRRVGLVGRGGRQPSHHFVLVGRPKLWWNANFSRCRSNPLVTSCSSDAQNCGEMQIFHVAEATLSSFRAHRAPKTVVKCKFMSCPKQPSRHFVLIGRPKLWWSANFLDPQNCGEMQILCALAQPSRHFVLVGKLWWNWNANFWAGRGTFSSLRAGRTFETVVKRWFLYAAGDCRRHALISYIFVDAAVAERAFWHFGWRAAVAKRTFWFSQMNPLVGFGGSIARNCGETQILSSWNCSAHWPGRVNVVFCICTIAPRIVFAITIFWIWSSQKICFADRALALEAGGPGLDSRLRRGVLCSTL